MNTWGYGIFFSRAAHFAVRHCRVAGGLIVMSPIVGKPRGRSDAEVAQMKSPGRGRRGLKDGRRGVGGCGECLPSSHVDGGLAVGASSFNRQGSPHSLSRKTAATAKPCKKMESSLFDRRARRPTYGLFELFNRIRQDLTTDRIVSFEDFRKFRVNGEALRANSLVTVPIGKGH